jgi:hypothetical protein
MELEFDGVDGMMGSWEDLYGYYKLFERSSPGGLGGTPMKRELL